MMQLPTTEGHFVAWTKITSYLLAGYSTCYQSSQPVMLSIWPGKIQQAFGK